MREQVNCGMTHVGHPLDLETLRPIIKALCKKYNVTGSVAAWQLQHGASSASWDELDPPAGAKVGRGARVKGTNLCQRERQSLLEFVVVALLQEIIAR
jgi:hypothetical protein